MVAVRAGLTVGLTALAALLVVLAAGSGVGAVGVSVALATGLGLTLAVARSAASQGVTALGPADLVTLTRATLSCGLVALVTEGIGGPADQAGVLVAIAAGALALDAVDGRVARRSGTATAFGARLDGEADAFLMLVLSLHLAGSHGAWVLAIGGYRYVFAVAGWALPWMRSALPARYWRKVVTAVAGIALVLAAADVTGPGVEALALAVALLLLTESFGRDVWWLWRHRARGVVHVAAPSAPARVPAG